MSKQEISFTVFRGSEDGSLHAATTKKPALTKDQVHVRVTASGVCGTDLHYQKDGIALGHEGVGVVEAVGPDVAELKVGDRVGWGYEHDSCGRCQQCLRGVETHCPERKMYALADTDQGSFATAAVWREAFLYKIPDELSDAEAAPLMCGGVTVFNALHGVSPANAAQATERIGVVGVGGLGHLAIQFAHALGAEVVVFSGTSKKKDEALKLGADEFHALKEEKDLSKTTKPLDRLLITTSAQVDWKAYMDILAPGAVVSPLSVAEGNLEVPYMPLLLNGITVQGSIVGPRWVHRQMLALAARHKIKPVIEKFELSPEGATKALERLEKGDVRYRAVLLPKDKL